MTEPRIAKIVTRPRRNEQVLRHAVSFAMCGYIVFAILLPIFGNEKSAAAWNVAYLLSPEFVAGAATCVLLLTLLSSRWLPLRMWAGVLFTAFCWMYASLVGEWRAALFAASISFLGIAYAWTGVPED